jgi:RNA polymerase sigma factor (sigma-70 family)
LSELDPEEHVDRDEGPERAYENREELMRVLEAVETSLDRDERLALWLRCEEALPVEEITGILGLTSPSGARGLLQTARRKLRAALRERDASDGEGK